MSVLFTDPDNGIIQTGQSFNVRIMLDGEDEVNAAQVNISWAPSILSLGDIDYTYSCMPVQAENFTGEGTARMARAISGGTPPISGLQEFARITFTANGQGEAIVHFDDTCQVIDAATFQDVLTSRTDGVFTIEGDIDLTPPSPPILGGDMPVTQIGAQLRVEGTEPTTNADGTPLGDLQKTVVTYDVGQGPVVGVEIPTTGLTGGGSFDQIFDVPIQGQQTTVSVFANAVDLVGNVSEPSQTITLTIDLLAPAPPVI